MSTSLPPSSSMADRRTAVCLCVDDFGLHPAINTAVLQLVHMGRVSATSAMVDGPAWLQGAAALRLIPARLLDVGLHLDFTEPVRPPLTAALPAPAPLLPRQSLRSLLLRAYLHRLDARTLREDIHRQLNAFEAALQRPPAYVDGHQHIHQLPQIRDALVDALLHRYHAHERPWLRHTQPVFIPAASMAERIKAHTIAALGAASLRQMASTHSLRMNRALTGVYGFDADMAHHQARLRLWLAHLRAGDILMCHPASDIVPDDPIAAARCCEYQILASDWMAHALAQHHLQPVPLSHWFSNHTP